MNITGLPVIGCSLFSWNLRLHPSGTFSGSLTEDGTPASKDENLISLMAFSCTIYLASSAVMEVLKKGFFQVSFPLEFWKHDFLHSVLNWQLHTGCFQLLLSSMGGFVSLWGIKKVELNWWQSWVPKWSSQALATSGEWLNPRTKCLLCYLLGMMDILCVLLKETGLPPFRTVTFPHTTYMLLGGAGLIPSPDHREHHGIRIIKILPKFFFLGKIQAK